MIDDLIQQQAKLQRQVDGLIKPEVGRWVDWTPTVYQNGNVAISVVAAKYKLSENLINIYAQINITGAGAGATAISVSGWPVAFNPNPTPSGWPIGVANVVDTGVSWYGCIAIAYSATAILFLARTDNFAGLNPSFTLANGDFIYLNAYWKV